MKSAINTGYSELTFRKIQDMPRGGSQQDASQFFRNEWANTKPAEAVQYFDELLAMRDHQEDGSRNRPTQDYANRLMSSWFRKAPEAAQAYIANEPQSPKRTVLANALKMQLEKAEKK